MRSWKLRTRAPPEPELPQSPLPGRVSGGRPWPAPRASPLTGWREAHPPALSSDPGEGPARCEPAQGAPGRTQLTSREGNARSPVALRLRVQWLPVKRGLTWPLCLEPPLPRRTARSDILTGGRPARSCPQPGGGQPLDLCMGPGPAFRLLADTGGVGKARVLIHFHNHEPLRGRGTCPLGSAEPRRRGALRGGCWCPREYVSVSWVIRNQKHLLPSKLFIRTCPEVWFLTYTCTEQTRFSSSSGAKTRRPGRTRAPSQMVVFRVRARLQGS